MQPPIHCPLHTHLRVVVNVVRLAVRRLRLVPPVRQLVALGFTGVLAESNRGRAAEGECRATPERRLSLTTACARRIAHQFPDSRRSRVHPGRFLRVVVLKVEAPRALWMEEEEGVL